MSVTWTFLRWLEGNCIFIQLQENVAKFHQVYGRNPPKFFSIKTLELVWEGILRNFILVEPVSLFWFDHEKISSPLHA